MSLQCIMYDARFSSYVHLMKAQPADRIISPSLQFLCYPLNGINTIIGYIEASLVWYPIAWSQKAHVHPSS